MKATIIQLVYIDQETEKVKFLFEKQIDGEIPDNNVIVSIDYKILPPCGKCGARAVHYKYMHHGLCKECWGDNTE